jgi:hypothetical protein
MMMPLVVECGFVFDKVTPFDQLKMALQKTLARFPILAGRMEMKDGKTVMNCNDTGLPITHEIS